MVLNRFEKWKKKVPVLVAERIAHLPVAGGQAEGLGNKVDRRGGEGRGVVRQLLGNGVVPVFPYPEETEPAPPGPAEVTRDGKKKTAPVEARGSILPRGQEGKMQILVENSLQDEVMTAEPSGHLPLKTESPRTSAETIASLDKQLWRLSNLLLLVLSIGLLSFMFPAAFWLGQELSIKVPERAFYGLCVLLSLTLAYLVQKQVKLRKLLNEQLVHTAFHDALTGLPNRTLFSDRLRVTLARSKRNQDDQFAVLYMDLDRFKIVNDSMGHRIGDQLLLETSHRLQDCLRTTDMVARLGGDEFAILLDDIKQIEDMLRTVERIQKRLQVPLKLEGREVFVNASIGIALSSTGYDRPEDFLRDADTAMYRAKSHGGGRYEIFDASMHEHALKVLQLETDLRRAIERQELRLAFQPIVSLQTGQIAGFEALVRWLHPDRGLLLPGEFIEFAERTGLIIPITRWVLQDACSELSKWQTRFPANMPLSVSVNLTAKYFSQKNLCEEIADLISKNKLAPENLILEITESEIMKGPQLVSSSLSRLMDSGIKVHIDDFGTGYSSLGYLSSFPVHALKIDRTFVRTLSGEDKNSAIVRAVVSLAHDLGLEVVAEGVETAEQLDYLRAVKCQYGQGFYFSPPLDSKEVARLLPEWSGVSA